MRTRNLIVVLMSSALMLGPAADASAQLNKLIYKAKDSQHRIENAIKQGRDRRESREAAQVEADYQTNISSGKTYYVNAATGSNRNDGATPETAIKDLQKAINIADEGSVICVSEGNYLGTLDQGFIEVKKYISLVGGYSSDFSERAPIRYKTWIRPDARHLATSGAHASMRSQSVEPSLRS